MTSRDGRAAIAMNALQRAAWMNPVQPLSEHAS